MTESTRMLLRSAAFLALMVVIGVAGMAVFALVERELHPAVATGPAAAGDKAAAAPANNAPHVPRLRQYPTRPHRICQKLYARKNPPRPLQKRPHRHKNAPMAARPAALLGQIPFEKYIFSKGYAARSFRSVLAQRHSAAVFVRNFLRHNG